MKSPFSIAAFIIGLIVFIAALLVTIATLINASESHPLSIVTFLIVAIVNIPEMPIGTFVSNLGFPIVVPTLTAILGVAGIMRKEPKMQLAIAGIVMVIMSIGLYVYLGTLR